jgi:hypothetical protein
MNRIAALAAVAALVAVAAGPTGASAAIHRWRLTADVTGGYRNDVTGAARCPAHYQESVTGLRVRFTSTAPVAYDPEAPALAGRLRYVVRGGRWAVSGQYVPVVAQPDGSLACGDAPAPLSCGAKVVADDGRAVRTRGAARLAVEGTSRTFVRARLDGPRLTEQYADTRGAPAGWPSPCRVAPDDETVPVAPFFGLASTEIADRELARRFAVPRAKLTGHRRFVVRVPASRPNGCPAQGFDPCSEHGGFVTRITFSPA